MRIDHRFRRAIPFLFAGLFAVAGGMDAAQAQNAPRGTRPQSQVNRTPAGYRAPQQATAVPTQPSHLRPNSVKLTLKDIARLNRTAKRFDWEIRAKFTPVVDLHVTEGSTSKGVQFRKINDPRRGATGATVFEITGTEHTGGMVDFVMSGGASGHVMQQHYGGRDISVVENYGKEDTLFLRHKGPGATQSSEVLKVQSRGLVTQEGFAMKLDKGTHNFYYFRGGRSGGSGGEGSEPELRTVTLIVK